jgi:hypothetical protein
MEFEMEMIGMEVFFNESDGDDNDDNFDNNNDWSTK